jgi:DNA (cytosine-5)-methyltransferase 1
MNFLSLFSGIGGFDIALERVGMCCVGQVEKDDFCQAVLAHHWPDVKRIGDIRDVNGTEFGAVDLICGGFPCQPFSHAGKRKGKADDRYLWPEMLRVIQAYRPAWVLGENVAGIVNMALDTVLSDLEAQGYQCEAFIIPACAVDAPHERKRVWILANSNVRRDSGNFGQSTEKNRVQGDDWSEICSGVFSGTSNVADTTTTGRGTQLQRVQASAVTTKRSADVPDADSPGLGERRRAEPVQPEQCAAECAGEDAADTSKSTGESGEPRASQRTIQGGDERLRNIRLPERGVCRMDDGLSSGLDRRAVWPPEDPEVPRIITGQRNRVHRLRALGNAVVPAVVEEIGRAIIAIDS